MKRKQITTTLKGELLKEFKRVAFECECGLNDVIEVALIHLKNNWNQEEIKRMVIKHKEEK